MGLDQRGSIWLRANNSFSDVRNTACIRQAMALSLMQFRC